MKQRPRVLALLPDKMVDMDGVSFVRIAGPFSILQQAGYPVEFMPYDKARKLARERAGISGFDLFVFPRAAEKTGLLTQLFKSVQSTGKKIVWETDDDYTNKYRTVIDADAITPAKQASAITVSVPNLVTVYREITDKPIYLLQNTIDRVFWNAAMGKREIKAITIGLVGTKTHYNDWSFAKDALYRIAEKYQHIHFVIGGYLPDYLQDLPRLTFIPPCRYQDYPHMVRQIDIGLAPLDPDDQFNVSKSAIKVLEYWASGTAVIATDCSVYRRVVTNGQNGLLCTSPNDWFESISLLIEDAHYRNMIVVSGDYYLKTKRDMHRRAIEWWETYKEIYNG